MYKNKYLKYKTKYLKLKNLTGGTAMGFADRKISYHPSESNTSSRTNASNISNTSSRTNASNISNASNASIASIASIASNADLLDNNYFDPSLRRSISIPTDYDEQQVYENSSLKINSGYSSNKRLIINNKEIIYTEDAHARFSFGNYDILIIADGHGGTPDISRKSVALAQGYFKEFLERENNDVSLALTKLCKFIHDETKKQMQGGSTFNMAVIDKTNNKLYSANLGDSVLLILRKNKINNQYELIFRTHSHDAADLAEQARIKQIHPNHQFYKDGPSWRMQNGLMPTRGFGDILKDNPIGIVGRIPEIVTIDLESDDLIIQSSDGLYETYNIDNPKISGNEEIRIPQIIAEVNKNSDIIGLPERLLDDQAEQIKIIIGSDSDLEDIKNILDNQSIHVYKVKDSSRPPLLKINSM
jgi:serine/threonine protein phosphatase PrpC